MSELTRVCVFLFAGGRKHHRQGKLLFRVFGALFILREMLRRWPMSAGLRLAADGRLPRSTTCILLLLLLSRCAAEAGATDTQRALLTTSVHLFRHSLSTSYALLWPAAVLEPNFNPSRSGLLV